MRARKHAAYDVTRVGMGGCVEPDRCKHCKSDTPSGMGLTNYCPVCAPEMFDNDNLEGLNDGNDC